MSGPWQGRSAHTVVDPWGRAFSAGSRGDHDLVPSSLNGSGSWNQRSAQTSAHNGWGGGQSLNAQQAQQQQMHADYSMSQYVAGLPGEIIEQVHGAALTNARV